MRKYNTVIFDLDGTLLDTIDDLTEAVNYALSETGMQKRSREEVRKFVGNGARRLLELCVPDGDKNPLFEDVLGKFHHYYGEHCNDKTKVYDGMTDLLKELKDEGYALAIVSNKPDSAVRELSRIYFNGLVETAVGEREGIARKPSPDTVLAALTELGKGKEEAVYVGDSEVDIATAHNAGIACISVLWGFRDRELLKQHGAAVFASSPSDVKAFL